MDPMTMAQMAPFLLSALKTGQPGAMPPPGGGAPPGQPPLQGGVQKDQGPSFGLGLLQKAANLGLENAMGRNPQNMKIQGLERQPNFSNMGSGGFSPVFAPQRPMLAQNDPAMFQQLLSRRFM